MFSEYKLRERELPLHVMAGPSTGPPLLLLHGVGRCWQDFIPLISALSNRWRVLALDFRGHGLSARTAGRYRVADYLEDALALLHHAREPAVIYGHSLGALVAGAVAAASPDAVRAVVLEDPPGAGFLDRLHETPYFALFTAMQRLAGSREAVSVVARQLGETRLPTADARGEVRLADVRDATSIRFSARCLADVDPEVYAPVLQGRWLSGFDADIIWQGVHCPALLLRADDACGGMLPIADADAMTRQMADCTRVELPGIGHLIHWYATETTLRLVQGFLESLK